MNEGILKHTTREAEAFCIKEGPSIKDVSPKGEEGGYKNAQIVVD